MIKSVFNALTVALLMVSLSLNYVYLNKTSTPVPSHDPVHAALVHVSSDSIRSRLFNRLMGDDAFSIRAKLEVFKYAKSQGTDLATLSPSEIFVWIVAHKAEIIKLLMEILPLVI